MQVCHSGSTYIRGFDEEKVRMGCSVMCRCIRGLIWMESHIYAVSVKGKCIWKLGFAEEWSMKCLICSDVLLQSFNDVFYSSGLFELTSISFDVWLSLNVWSGSSLKIWWKVAYKLCSKESIWIQCENWWNVVHGGTEGCSLNSGGCSSLPGEAGKWEQGVVAPFQERLVNERRWVPAY